MFDIENGNDVENMRLIKNSENKGGIFNKASGLKE